MTYIEEFKALIKKDFDDWSKDGKCAKALQLNSSIGGEYFDTANPHYFTGDLASELVLLHLDPKSNSDQYNKGCTFKDFEAYWEFYTKVRLTALWNRFR